MANALLAERKKRCTHCRKRLPLARFSPSQWERPGSWCKKCGNTARREKRSGEFPVRFTNVCLWCDADITHMRAHAKYCSTSCSAKAWKDAHPGRQREIRLKHAYGITPEQYEALFASQKRRCAICHCKHPGRQWHVDHDHDTGEVRGILCGNCNEAIGKLRDDPKLLRAAYRYLTRERVSIGG